MFCCSNDGGISWSKPKIFLSSNAGGLFYLDIRKQHLYANGREEEQWFFALYGHPVRSKDHKIRSGIFSSDGRLLKMDGTPTKFHLYDPGTETIDLDSLETVCNPPEGKTVRLLDVSPTVPPRVGFACFEMDKLDAPSPEKAYYVSAVFRDGTWNLSEPICSAGEFMAKNIKDGSQSYLGGMAYYYGIGRIAVHDPVCVVPSDRLYIARYDGKDRVLESYITTDDGNTYQLEQVIRRISGEQNIKIWRPIVPIHAQDNLPVYWHEGVYTSFNGGWHSDAVMYVEFDD